MSTIYKSGYRRLLKAAQFAFQGDVRAQQQARQQLKVEFFRNKDVSDAAALRSMAKDVDEIEEMLRFNIVQGQKNDKGNFAVSLKDEHKVTIEAHQDLPHGPELSPIEPSFIGQHVAVSKTKGSGVIDSSKFKPAL